MQSHNQCPHFWFAEVLKFVDANRDCLMTVSRSLSDCEEELREICLKIATVRSTLFRLHPNLKFNVVNGGLRPQTSNKAAEHPHSPFDLLAYPGLAVKRKEDLPEMRCEERRQWLTLMCLDKNSLE